MKNVKNVYYINNEIYVNSYDEFMETIENESLDNDEFSYLTIYHIEVTDDYIQMNEPADYYKDEYGICPCCKHKLSKKEMERKRCSKCLQKLSGKTIAFTRKGLIKCNLVVRSIIFLIMLLIILFSVFEPIQVILGIAIIVLVILLVWGIVYAAL